jgi:hypothetical protein
MIVRHKAVTFSFPATATPDVGSTSCLRESDTAEYVALTDGNRGYAQSNERAENTPGDQAATCDDVHPPRVRRRDGRLFRHRR